MRSSAAILCLLVLMGSVSAQTRDLHSFKKITLTKDFYAEGAGIGDINQDGKPDVIYGPYWYEGPDFKTRHEIYKPEVFDPTKYSNNFITFVYDVNNDKFPDILVNIWPGKEVFWYENPQNKGTAWKKHVAYPKVDNESPGFGDITGDGKPELIFHTGGILGYANPDPKDPTKQWKFTPISEKEKYGQYTHGLGFGDVTGDGKPDFLLGNAWWEQTDKSPWTKHAAGFGNGAHMHVYDVDGDGLNDIVTSLQAHGYGLAWFKQVKDGGKTTFQKNLILGDKPSDSPYGLRFSQLHAVELVDIDGDGLKDIVTGKRYWAHGPKGDVEPEKPAVLYWFKLVRTNAKGAHFIPYQIDDDSGVGTQFSVGDLNGDKLPDIVIGNKKGGYIFLHEVKKVSQEEYDKAQPRLQQGS
ncbi:MAG: FG-GAP repeat domain-containing protein [Gemmataceae bacterium]